MRHSKFIARGRATLFAGSVLALVTLSACGGSSAKTATTQPLPASGQNTTNSSGGSTGGATAHVDLTSSGAVKFHITGTKATCNSGGVDLSSADYPEVHDNLHIGSFNGRPEFKWLYASVIYTENSTVAGVTLTTQPFKVVLNGTKLVAAVPIGTPAQPGVTLTGTITCPG